MPSVDRPGPPGWFEPEPLPWSWAERQLVRATNYWVATASAEGVPHTRPVWGVWLDGGLSFSAGGPRMVANLAANGGDVTVHLESGDRVVILEGSVTETAPTAAFIEAYNAKYDWDFSLDAFPGVLLAFAPRVGYGWTSDPDDRGQTFKSTGSRWSF